MPKRWLAPARRPWKWSLYVAGRLKESLATGKKASCGERGGATARPIDRRVSGPPEAPWCARARQCTTHRRCNYSWLWLFGLSAVLRPVACGAFSEPADGGETSPCSLAHRPSLPQERRQHVQPGKHHEAAPTQGQEHSRPPGLGRCAVLDNGCGNSASSPWSVDRPNERPAIGSAAASPAGRNWECPTLQPKSPPPHSAERSDEWVARCWGSASNGSAGRPRPRQGAPSLSLTARFPTERFPPLPWRES